MSVNRSESRSPVELVSWELTHCDIYSFNSLSSMTVSNLFCCLNVSVKDTVWIGKKGERVDSVFPPRMKSLYFTCTYIFTEWKSLHVRIKNEKGKANNPVFLPHEGKSLLHLQQDLRSLYAKVEYSVVSLIHTTCHRS